MMTVIGSAGDTVNNQCSMFAVVFDVEVSTNNGLF